MHIIEAEKKLANHLAELLSLEPDRQIFAGNIPEAVPEGISVDFRSGRPATVNRINCYHAEIRGRFRSRSGCRDAVDIIAAELPSFGTAGFVSIKLNENTPVNFSDSGLAKSAAFEFELMLEASFV